MKPPILESPAKDLFQGEILSNLFFPFPEINQTEQETLRLVIDSVSKFMQEHEHEFREHDVKGEQPDDYLQSLKELGLFGLIIPEEYGGLGLSNSGYSRVLQETSKLDPSTSLTIGAHSSIGMKALLLFGNPEQKAKYLPDLATGERMAAFCLTEAGAGSDAASIKTAATKNPDGSWTLNGEKIWITNGGTARFFTVFAKTDSEAGRMSAFIVERDWAGVSSGPKEDKMGIRASCTTTVSFNDVQVPKDALLGEEGKGFKIAMAVLNNGRTGLGGGCVGGMKRLIELSIRQASERKQFGVPIASYQLIKEKIGVMTALCFSSESVVSMVGSYIDRGFEDFSVEAAISKIFVTEALWKVGNEALQIAGGNGFMREFPYERMVRDSRINLIFEGTNEILRLYVGLSGMKDAGDALKEVASGLSGIFNDPIKGFGMLSKYATKKVSQMGSGSKRNTMPLPSALVPIGEEFALGATRLSQSVERSLKKYRKNIIGAQLVTKRIADSAILLFVGICTLSRVAQMVEAKGESNCQTEIMLMKWYANYARENITEWLRGLERNEDAALLGVADAMIKEGKFGWDVV